ncbi:ATP-binding protein [candidate division NPL-UPA2 bacterium]|nr:ATP-binding protein [candidate division NPL-UPA2 bacterium]
MQKTLLMLEQELAREKKKNVELLEKLRRASDELEEAQENLRCREKLTAVTELTAGIVHEIRNPLSIIAMSVQYLVSRTDKDDPRRAFVEAILRKVEKIDEINKNLIKFGRPRQLIFTKQKVNDLLRRALELIKLPCEERKVQIVEEMTAEPLEIMADGDGIEKVLLNLLNNAIEAMTGGGLLTVKTSYQVNSPARVIIKIKDTGVGIAEEEREKIFLPFFSKKENGTGLGLTISHRIVSEHGGQIKVESNQNETAFSIFLPLKQ